MERERTGHSPSCTEAKKMKSQLRTCVVVFFFVQVKETSQGQDELKVKLVKRREQLKQELLAARKLLITSDCQGIGNYQLKN